jgi:hypothetical protein
VIRLPTAERLGRRALELVGDAQLAACPFSGTVENVAEGSLTQPDLLRVRGHAQRALDVDRQQLERPQPDLKRALAYGVQQQASDLLQGRTIRW